MLSNKKLCLQMLGLEAGGAFLSLILLFAYRMVATGQSLNMTICYIGGSFVTVAYLVLIYGWIWQVGNRDAKRLAHEPDCYGKNRVQSMILTMAIPNVVILLMYIKSIMDRLAGETSGFITFARLLATAWFSPFFEWMYPLGIGPNSANLFPFLILFAIPAPLTAYIAYRMGLADKSIKGFFIKFLPEKQKEEFPEQKKQIAKDILTDENYKNIYRKKPPKE